MGATVSGIWEVVIQKSVRDVCLAVMTYLREFEQPDIFFACIPAVEDQSMYGPYRKEAIRQRHLITALGMVMFNFSRQTPKATCRQELHEWFARLFHRCYLLPRTLEGTAYRKFD